MRLRRKPSRLCHEECKERLDSLFEDREIKIDEIKRLSKNELIIKITLYKKQIQIIRDSNP